MTYQTLAAFFVQKMRVLGYERGNLGVNRSPQKFLRTRLNDLR